MYLDSKTVVAMVVETVWNSSCTDVLAAPPFTCMVPELNSINQTVNGLKFHKKSISSHQTHFPNAGFIQKNTTFFQGLFKDFLRTKSVFQGLLPEMLSDNMCLACTTTSKQYRTTDQFGFSLHFHLPLACFCLLFKYMYLGCFAVFASHLRSEKGYQSLSKPTLPLTQLQ